MGKKKRKQKKNSDLKEPLNQKKKYLLPLVVVVFAIMVVTILLVNSENQADIPEKPMRLSPFDLMETKPVLSPAIFYGRTALAYQYASEIPEVIDNQFCYCYCRKNFNHKTLLTCFTGNHGANCAVCQNEVFRSYQLHKEGLPVSEITKKIDKEFYRKQM